MDWARGNYDKSGTFRLLLKVKYPDPLERVRLELESKDAGPQVISETCVYVSGEFRSGCFAR
jgi:hypothetical protein